MNISREKMIAELKTIKSDLAGWIGELDKPTVFDGAGKSIPAYAEGELHSGVSVGSLRGIPVDQLRSELLLMAAKLEALVST